MEHENRTLFGICLITEDVRRLVSFYEAVLGVKGEGDDIHMELHTDGCGMAIYAREAAERDMGFDFSAHWGTGGTTLMFRVDDADREFERLQSIVPAFMTTPTTYPWGARAFHFRDPDGNIIDFVTPPKR